MELFIKSISFINHFRYEQCSWGWSDQKKKDELSDDAAWYLIAKSVEGNLLGFSHFRFDLDEGIEVLYW